MYLFKKVSPRKIIDKTIVNRRRKKKSIRIKEGLLISIETVQVCFKLSFASPWKMQSNLFNWYVDFDYVYIWKSRREHRKTRVSNLIFIDFSYNIHIHSTLLDHVLHSDPARNCYYIYTFDVLLCKIWQKPNYRTGLPFLTQNFLLFYILF